MFSNVSHVRVIEHRSFSSFPYSKSSASDFIIENCQYLWGFLYIKVCNGHSKMCLVPPRGIFWILSSGLTGINEQT